MYYRTNEAHKYIVTLSPKGIYCIRCTKCCEWQKVHKREAYLITPWASSDWKGGRRVAAMYIYDSWYISYRSDVMMCSLIQITTNEMFELTETSALVAICFVNMDPTILYIYSRIAYNYIIQWCGIVMVLYHIYVHIRHPYYVCIFNFEVYHT